MSIKEAESLLDVFIQLLSYLKVLNLSGLESEVFKIAVETGLTVYDASYLALARREKLILVTEDVKLRSVASMMIQVVSLDELTAETHVFNFNHFMKVGLQRGSFNEYPSQRSKEVLVIKIR